MNYEMGKMKMVSGGIRLNRKAPQRRFLRGYSVQIARSRLLLGSSGFAGTHFEAFFAKYTAALFGSFFKLLSHKWGELVAEGTDAVNCFC